MSVISRPADNHMPRVGGLYLRRQPKSLVQEPSGPRRVVYVRLWFTSQKPSSHETASSFGYLAVVLVALDSGALSVAPRTPKIGVLSFEFEWGVYALSASNAIFRARTYNCITYSVR